MTASNGATAVAVPEVCVEGAGGDEPRHPPAVAVVAVHGVADQQPRDSARAITDLLLGLGEEAAYTPAHEGVVRVPTRPVRIAAPDPPMPAPRSRIGGFFDTLFDDRSRYVRCLADRTGGALPRPDETADDETHAAPDYWFMREQLVDYRASGAPYETVRLETQRLGVDGRPAADVHVYELYWADLSRVAHGGLRVLGEFYQLLFHASSLGRITLDYAAIEHDYRGVWRWLNGTYKWAARLLTVVIPVLSLVLLAVGGTLYTLSLRDDVRVPIAAVVPGLVVATVMAIRRYRRGAPRSFALMSASLLLVVLLPVGVTLAALTLSLLPSTAGEMLPYLLALEWLVVAGLLLYIVCRAFNRHRPGALPIAAVSYVLAAACFFGLLFARSHREDGQVTAPFATDAPQRVAEVTLWTVQVVWATTAVAWAAFGVLAAVTWVLGERAVRSVPRDGDRWARLRARNAVRTARLTLAMPAAAFLLTTTVLWSAVIDATDPFVPPFQHRSLWGHMHEDGSIREFLHDLLWRSTTLGLPVALILFAVGAVVVSWWFVPIAVAEARPPAQAEGPLSARMGAWFDRGAPYAARGLVVLVAASGAAFAGLFLLANVELFASVLSLNPAVLDWLHMEAEPGSGRSLLFAERREFVEWVGRITAAGAVGVLALRGRLTVLSARVRPLLDVLLDVDGYLREHPREATPRARIAERYVSLLRYLCAWRSPDGRPYERIVVVAHSQGTVITADTLGFVQRERDDALAALYRDEPATPARPKVDLVLFTMGSPLRQLYARFFPHLYSWVASRPVKWRAMDLVRGGGDEDEVETRGGDRLWRNPDPAGLQLARWVNAYRSADYVGRHLWRKKDSATLFEPRARDEDVDGRRVELCIGAGAHTHYWNARPVAEELDRLVLTGAGVRAAAAAPTA